MHFIIVALPYHVRKSRRYPKFPEIASRDLHNQAGPIARLEKSVASYWQWQWMNV
jgi:hypothetical protein